MDESSSSVIYRSYEEVVAAMQCTETKALLLQVQYKLDRLGVIKMRRAKCTLSADHRSGENRLAHR